MRRRRIASHLPPTVGLLCLCNRQFFLPSATFWTRRGHRCPSFSPPVVTFIFMARRVWQSHLPATYDGRFCTVRCGLQLAISMFTADVLVHVRNNASPCTMCLQSLISSGTLSYTSSFNATNREQSPRYRRATPKPYPGNSSSGTRYPRRVSGGTRANLLQIRIHGIFSDTQCIVY